MNVNLNEEQKKISDQTEKFFKEYLNNNNNNNFITELK